MSRNKGKIRASKLSLDPRIFIKRREELDAHVNKRVLTELRKFQVYGAHELIYEIATHPELPEIFSPLYGREREHYEVAAVGHEITPDGYIYWLLGMFMRHAKILSDFNFLRHKINAAILNGEPSKSKELISSLNEISKSWWAIDVEFHITKELEFKDTKQLAQELPNRFKRAKIGKRILDIQLLSESSTAAHFIAELLDRMKEYRTSGLEHAITNGDLESCESLPAQYDRERNVKIESLHNRWFESLIDQYCYFKEVICELVVCNKLPIGLAPKIKSIAAVINDAELLSILQNYQDLAPEVSATLDDYTKGNYEQVVERVKRLLRSGSDEMFGLIEIYAKSKIYLGASLDESTFFDHIANELAGILLCDQNSISKIEFLKKICVKFKKELWAKSLNFHLLSALEETNDCGDAEIARQHTLGLGRLNTPKAKDKNYHPSTQDIDLCVMPSHRVMRYSGNGQDNEIIDKSIFPVLADYLKLQARALMTREKHIEAINFVLNEYLENRISFLHLPVEKLCKHAIDIKNNDNIAFISCLVIYDIYFREYNSTFEDSKADLFEELMNFNGSHRPSEVFQNKELSTLEVYFLKNVCLPYQLDNLRNYTSNDEVIHERIAILDLLIEAKVDDPEQLQQERDNVLETLFSEKLRAKFESGKLFVDVQALESQRKHHYKSLFEQARSTQGGTDLEPLRVDKESDDIFEIIEGRALASNSKTELLYAIFHTAVTDFALNENYGLDKYLSAEIRHIVFTTQLRSCFEKTHLVTSQKDGEYLPNTYWISKYNYVNPNIMNQIDSLLRDFSCAADEILSEINERFRVELHDRESTNAFDFIAYHHRLVRVSQIISKSENSDNFFSMLLEYLWELAGEGARVAQVLINDDLSPRINSALTTLEASINTVKGDAAVIDLMDEIKLARSLFTSNIEIVLNWFRFVGGNDSKNLERLGIVIEATISSFESIYGYKYECPVLTQTESESHLNYREARALFISLFTALENGCKYGGNSSPVMVEHKIDTAQNIIKITNRVSNYSGITPAELIEREKAKWTIDNAKLSRQEGGSGLYKIFNTLSNASPGFSFDIEACDSKFTAIIGMSNENFDHRRQLTEARESC